MNELSLVEPFLKPGFTNEDLLFHAFLASEAGANDAIELGIHLFITFICLYVLLTKQIQHAETEQ